MELRAFKAGNASYKIRPESMSSPPWNIKKICCKASGNEQSTESSTGKSEGGNTGAQRLKVRLYVKTLS